MAAPIPDPNAPSAAVIIASLPHGEDGAELLDEMHELLRTARVGRWRR